MSNINLKTAALAIGMAFFCACGQNPQPTAPPPAAPAAPSAPAAPASPEGCYRKLDGKDITAIELKISGTEASGYFSWEPFEKDGARGAFKGSVSGDVVTAVWELMIEGSIQKEEIVLKIADGKIMKGSGEMDEVKGVMTIKDKSKIEYPEVFEKVDCKEVADPIQHAREFEEMIKKAAGGK